jgi:uroporphyrinogen decarboxylase
MGYMIEGGGSKTMSKAKHWLEAYPNESLELLTLLKDVIVDYLVMQVENGAQMLQVFESSAEHLPKETFLKLALPLMKSIRDEVNSKVLAKNLQTVPMVIFAKGAMHSLPEIAATGYEVVGIDYSIDPLEARKMAGPNVTLQGNLDPQDLYKPQEEVARLTKEMVKKFGKTRYIANLGHGITPQTPIESMTTFVNTVHTALDD